MCFWCIPQVTCIILEVWYLRALAGIQILGSLGCSVLGRCLHKIGAGGISCGKLHLEDTCTTLSRACHSSFLFMLLVGVCDLLHSVSFCSPRYLGRRRTEAGISKLCSCDPNVTSSFCFKACVMDFLLNSITAPISVRRFGMYWCAVNSSHFLQSQNSTCV